jgi:hypothetical protein
MNSVWCLFTHCQAFPNPCHHQVVVSITICCPEWSDIQYTWMPSPIHQNMVNLVVHLPIRRRRSIYECYDVRTWYFLAVRSLDVTKLSTLTPLSLLISCKLSFPIVGLKMYSLPIATGYGLDDQGGGSSSPGRVKNFHFSISSRPALGSTQPPIKWVPGVNRQGREADHSPPTSAEVKKMWIYTSTPLYVFMA